jgi:hypothetical protein
MPGLDHLPVPVKLQQVGPAEQLLRAMSGSSMLDSCAAAGCLAEGSALPLRSRCQSAGTSDHASAPFRQIPRLEGAAQPVALHPAEIGRSVDARRSGPQRSGHAPAEAHDERLELAVRNHRHTERGRGPINVRGPKR